MFGKLLDFINRIIERVWPKKRRKVKVLDARGNIMEAKVNASEALRKKSLN